MGYLNVPQTFKTTQKIKEIKIELLISSSIPIMFFVIQNSCIQDRVSVQCVKNRLNSNDFNPESLVKASLNIRTWCL